MTMHVALSTKQTSLVRLKQIQSLSNTLTIQLYLHFPVNFMLRIIIYKYPVMLFFHNQDRHCEIEEVSSDQSTTISHKRTISKRI